jgi:chromosome partitioning protein
MGFAENLGVCVNMKEGHSSVDADYHRWLLNNPDNRCFSQPVPRTSALQHASQLSAVERSYVAKYPGDSGTAIKLIAEELLTRLTAANAAGASPAPPRTSNAPLSPAPIPTVTD